jgi:hypothetical protein
MRHTLWLVPVVLALTASVAAAESVIGIGAYGGMGIPVGSGNDLYKDSKSSPNLGWRFPMAFSSAFSLEPFMDRIDGKPDEAYRGTIDGMDVMSYGVNLGLGRLVRNHGGLHLTPFGGIMMAKARREGGPGDDKLSWQGGLQIGLHGSETTHWDLRASYVNIGKLLDEEKHRNYVNVSLGLTCVVAPR